MSKVRVVKSFRIPRRNYIGKLIQAANYLNGSLRYSSAWSGAYITVKDANGSYIVLRGDTIQLLSDGTLKKINYRIKRTYDFEGV